VSTVLLREEIGSDAVPLRICGIVRRIWWIEHLSDQGPTVLPDFPKTVSDPRFHRKGRPFVEEKQLGSRLRLFSYENKARTCEGGVGMNITLLVCNGNEWINETGYRKREYRLHASSI